LRPNLVCAALAVLFAATPGFWGANAQTQAGGLELEKAWSRATPGGAKVAGGYLTIRNQGSSQDRLVSGTAEIAGRVEVHEMSHAEGVMRMRELEQGLPIAPGSSVELKPGGYHIMFRDLKRPLKQGERFKATLRFEKAGERQVEFRVESIGASSAGASHSGHLSH
jgi:hypothetical protein